MGRGSVSFATQSTLQVLPYNISAGVQYVLISALVPYDCYKCTERRKLCLTLFEG